jgi:putative ABC transport system substrate-binding protein
MRAIAFGLTLALVVLAAPLAAAEGQPIPGRTPRIGYLAPRSTPTHTDEAFWQGMRDLGYVEGQNLSVEYRWANWKLDRLPELAAELVRLNVEIIVSAGGIATALAAKKATRTVPIVFVAGDPVRSGLVDSLGRPGGNLTGMDLLNFEINAKRLELLKEVVPRVSRVAVMLNPDNPNSARGLKDAEAAAKALKLTVQVLEARDPGKIEEAFAAMTKERAGALLVLPDPMLFAQRQRIVGLAAKSRVPGIYEWREFAEAGGLMSYGTRITDVYRRLATYVDKILKGAKPGDLPVEQPTRFELVINLKTAKALGLTIPPSVRLRADHLIQ